MRKAFVAMALILLLIGSVSARQIECNPPNPVPPNPAPPSPAPPDLIPPNLNPDNGGCRLIQIRKPNKQRLYRRMKAEYLVGCRTIHVSVEFADKRGDIVAEWVGWMECDCVDYVVTVPTE